MSQRIGLFGGTFDPVHHGHISIAESFLKTDHIDQLWVLLTPYPPHKQQDHKTSYEKRLDMLKAAFSGFDNLSIKTIENRLPKPSYTVQTVRYLKKEHPDYTFYFCMGEDSLSQFHTWKFYQEILEECDLLVANRPGVTHEDVEPQILSHTHFVDHNPLDISSSEIRELAKAGKAYENFVPDNVAKIIDKEQLYS
ncbi:MAG: nicotinate (nicotinamide) nucleotide adenylyltransferase [Balneolaceae bacterium]